jgi:hypothetical protein
MYRNMLTEVLSRELPTVVCTIYYPAFEDLVLQWMASGGLTSLQVCCLIINRISFTTPAGEDLEV